jgi:serine/threonine protein kinase
MEKAPGVSLDSIWSSPTQQEIEKLAQSMVDIKAKLFSIRFSATDSLYFKKDTMRNLQVPLYKESFEETASEFCIGPIADHKFWYDSRAHFDLRRLPWTSPVDYLHSIAQREIEWWTREYGRPREAVFPHNTMGLGIQQPEEYVELLESYQSLAPHLLVKDPAHPSNRPTLRHPDPSPSNILISPDGRISCLIDWQHVIVQPRLLASGYSGIFANPDDA